MELFRTVPAEEADLIRRRLPHVPMEFSGTIEADDIDPDLLKAPGWPRPRYRSTPFPASSYVIPGKLNIIASDDEEWRRTLSERRCDLCAETLDEERLWLFGETLPETLGWLLVRGCLHRRCWVSTAHWCVHIRDRLLDGTMCAGSVSQEQSRDEDVFQILDKLDSEFTAAANIIAEYHILGMAVRPEWPFRPLGPRDARLAADV